MADAVTGGAGSEDLLRAQFNALDTDGSGSLSHQEVKKALRNAKKFAGEAQLQQLFDACDKDGDGVINFDEFKLLMALPAEAGESVLRCMAAEFIGLILFQFFGGLANAGPAGNGVVLAVLIFNTAAISGGHLNPAVTFALAVTQQIPPVKMVLYWIAQFVGGIVGAAMYTKINIKAGQTHTGCTVPKVYPSGQPGLTAGNVFGMEFIATFLLVFTVFGTAVDPRTGAGNFAPIAIGFSLFVSALAIGGFTGAGLNPARTLCPALVHDCWTNKDTPTPTDNYQWAYVLAQFLAGAFAGLLYKYAFMTRPGDGQKKAAAAFQFMALESKAIRDRLATKAD